jgi:hypothetical protein
MKSLVLFQNKKKMSIYLWTKVFIHLSHVRMIFCRMKSLVLFQNKNNNNNLSTYLWTKVFIDLSHVISPPIIWSVAVKLIGGKVDIHIWL